MGRLRRIGIGIAIVIALLIAWEPTRVAIQTAVLLPNLLGSGPMPLTLFSEAPQRSSVAYRPGPDGGDPDLAELWLPAWASREQPAGAVLLVLGVNNVGRNHPVVERVADGLARTGLAVLVPDSRTLLEGRLDVGEVDGVVRAYQLLASRPEVDAGRIGIAGFSVGGSLSLLAARDPRIAGDVRWVNAFGAFADARSYLAAVAAHAYLDDGEQVPWSPSDMALEVYLQFMLDQVVDPDDRERLDDAVGGAVLAGERPAAGPGLHDGLRTDPARTVLDLLTATSLGEARSAIAELPPASLAFIDAISPIRHLDGLEADVFLMHETTDHHVPVVESRALGAALEERGGPLREHTEFRLFDHVQPDDIDVLSAAPELMKLLLHVRTLLEESL